MKHALSIILAVFLTLPIFLSIPGVYGQEGAGKDPLNQPNQLDNREVRVDGKELFINSNKFPLPGERRILVGLLGKPTRVSEKANTILIWDELGIFAYERPGGGPIIQVNVALGEINTLEFWPIKAFRGKLSVDGAVVSPDTTIDEINRVKKGKPFVQRRFIEFCSDIEYEDVLVNIKRAKNGRFDPSGVPAEFLIGMKRPKR